MQQYKDFLRIPIENIGMKFYVPYISHIYRTDKYIKTYSYDHYIPYQYRKVLPDNPGNSPESKIESIQPLHLGKTKRKKSSLISPHPHNLIEQHRKKEKERNALDFYMTITAIESAPHAKWLISFQVQRKVQRIPMALPNMSFFFFHIAVSTPLKN